jgi:hypothetical protein
MSGVRPAVASRRRRASRIIAFLLAGTALSGRAVWAQDPDIVVNGANSMPAYSGGPGTVTNILGAHNNPNIDVLTITTTSTYAGLTNVGGTAAGNSVTLKGGAIDAFGPTSDVSVFTGSILDSAATIRRSARFPAAVR